MVHLEPVAVVTGATRGIGKQIVQKLSSQGLSCVCVGSSRQSIAKITLGDHLHNVNENQRHRSIAVDLSKWPQWATEKKHQGMEYVPRTLDSLYPLMDFSSWNSPHRRYCLSLLVNCAGITQSSISLRTPADEIQRIMNTNFMSAVSMCNLATRSMIRNRSYTSTIPLQIINVSSILGQHELTVNGTSIYSASKAAMSHYTKVLSQEVSDWGIRVNSIAPGLVSGTDMVEQLNESSQTTLKDLISSRNQTSTPREIASEVWSIYSSD